jgi:hypothetical protein
MQRAFLIAATHSSVRRAGRHRYRWLHGLDPKKKAKGKTLSVQVNVNYQGAAKAVPLTFKSDEQAVERAVLLPARSTTRSPT